MLPFSVTCNANVKHESEDIPVNWLLIDGLLSRNCWNPFTLL